MPKTYIAVTALLLLLSTATEAQLSTKITASASSSQFSNVTTQQLDHIGAIAKQMPRVMATASSSVTSASASTEPFNLSISCSASNSGIGLPAAQSTADDAMIQFFETPELAKLMVAGSGGVDVFLKYHLSFNNKCTFSSASDQCAAFLNTEWIIQQPYFSSTGRLQYAHDGAGFHNQALGIFKDAQFEESDMTARIPARIYAADQYYVPKYTLRIGLVSIDCSVLSVLSTSARSELIVTLQDEPSAITLTDGTPLVISAFDI